MTRPTGSEATRYATGAVADTTTVALLASAPLLGALCRDRGLELTHLKGVPRGRHPVVLELWRVRDGRPELDGHDQHEWSERTASAAGALTAAPLGAMVGAGLGAWMGPLGWWWSAGAGWVGGATLGGRLAATAGRQLSEATARALGTYDEIAVTIPGVALPDGRGPCQLVLGMYTNSTVALWTAQTFGYGYGKRLAQLDAEAFRAWSIHEEAGTVLDATFDPPTRWAAPGEVEALAALRAWTSQPFLGAPRPGRLALSYLDRAYEDPATSASTGAGVVRIRDGFLGPLSPGEHVPVLVAHAAGLSMRLSRAVPV